MHKAVILARGLGTRMRRNARATGLTPGQAAVAAAGMKAMMPVGDRPFLDHVLTALADAGFREVCLVIGQEHLPLRRHYAAVSRRRLEIDFAVQDLPLGTADAVSAAVEFTGDDPFLVLNGDNYYPVGSLETMRGLGENGLAAFDRDALTAESGIPPDRIARFALIEKDEDGYLTRITEKPDPGAVVALAGPVRVSMNCWRFDAGIYPAIRAIQPSSRGELELPDAVQHAMENMGARFRVVDVAGGVLDLTTAGDVRGIASRLKRRGIDL